MKNRRVLLGIVVLFVLTFGVMTPATGDVSWTETQGKVNVETDSLWVEVTGQSNVPAYSFRGQEDSNSTRHRAQFVQLFEFEDTDDDGVYDSSDTKIDSTIVALASLDVALSAVSETGSGSSEISFNMSLTAKAVINLNFDEVTFENHISSDNETRLKFDVVIDNYSFSTQGEMLGLAFKLTSTESNDTDIKQDNESSSIEFGENAYLESKNTATVGDSEVDVGTSFNQTANGSIMTYFSYPQFSGQLVHDPSLGVSPTGSDDTSDTDGGDEVSTYGGAPISLLGLGVALALLPILRKKPEN